MLPGRCWVSAVVVSSVPPVLKWPALVTQNSGASASPKIPLDVSSQSLKRCSRPARPHARQARAEGSREAGARGGLPLWLGGDPGSFPAQALVWAVVLPLVLSGHLMTGWYTSLRGRPNPRPRFYRNGRTDAQRGFQAAARKCRDAGRVPEPWCSQLRNGPCRAGARVRRSRQRSVPWVLKHVPSGLGGRPWGRPPARFLPQPLCPAALRARGQDGGSRRGRGCLGLGWSEPLFATEQPRLFHSS